MYSPFGPILKATFDCTSLLCFAYLSRINQYLGVCVTACVQHSRICAFVCDCLFTQFVIVSSSICIWRSIWNILDEFIFPQRHFRSDVVSLAAGFSVTSVILFSCWPLSAVSRRLDCRPTLKLLFENFIFLVLTWSCLLLWRGSWNLCVRKFLPADGPAGPAVGAWVSHALGTLGLMTLQTFNTVGLNGIDRDGSYTGGSGIFAISFLREVLPARCLVSWYFYFIIFACLMVSWPSGNGVGHVWWSYCLRRSWLCRGGWLTTHRYVTIHLASYLEWNRKWVLAKGWWQCCVLGKAWPHTSHASRTL